MLFPLNTMFPNILFLNKEYFEIFFFREKNISKYSFLKKRIFRNILYLGKEYFEIFFIQEKNIWKHSV